MMDPKEKEKLTSILDYLNTCNEQKEEKITILMRALSKSKVVEISQ